jgi:glycerophosphoryl diester phosphodiesterase
MPLEARRRWSPRSPGSRPVPPPAAAHPYLAGPRPRAYAHRGWHLDELAGLENTMAAFDRAVTEGFGYLELDVHPTADGVPVVHHDRTLDRTTDAYGPIGARSAAELAGVRVRGAHGREPVPHLADVLAALPQTRVTVELKAGAAVRPVLGVLDRLDAWDRVCLGGYQDAWLQAARRLARADGARLFTSMGQTSVVGLRVRAWAGANRGVPAPPVRGDLAQLPHRFGGLTVVDEAVLRVAHATGREVHVWTVDDPDEMASLLDLGADGLITDRPDLLRDLLRARGTWEPGSSS